MSEPDFDTPDLVSERLLSATQVPLPRWRLEELGRAPRVTLAHALMLGGLAAVLVATIWLTLNALRP